MKLNKSIREQILNALTERRLAKLDEELGKAAHAVGPAVYAALWPNPPQGDNLQGWVVQRTGFTYFMRGSNAPEGNNDVLTYPFLQSNESRHRKSAKDFRFDWGEPRYVPTHMYNSPSLDLNQIKDIPEFQKWEKLIAQAAKLRREIHEQAMRLLYSSTTVKGLLKIWPEVEPFIPAPVARQVSTAVVPVEQIKAVNKLIGLP